MTLGALTAWGARHNMNVDGISYLDMGDAILRGDWAHAVNAHWSPLYAALLGLTSSIVQPSAYWEFALAHAVNFAIFIAALAAAEVLLAEVLIRQRLRAADGEERVGLPEWAWRSLAYALVVWSSLDLIGLSLVTPDLLVAVFVYVAAALVLRIRRGAASSATFVGTRRRARARLSREGANVRARVGLSGRRGVGRRRVAAVGGAGGAGTCDVSRCRRPVRGGVVRPERASDVR